MTEYHDALSTLLGFRTLPLACALTVGDWQIPLAVVPYVGGGFIYLHAPVVAAWFHGWTDDPYLFRYVGILAYLADGWLIYFLAGRFWDRTTAWWAAVLWLTTPNLFFIAIADLQWELEPVAFAMLAMTLLCLSFEKNRASLFIVGCVVLGFVSTTRLDAFILLILCVSIYLLVVRPASVIEPAGKMLRERRWLVPAGFAAVSVGALPLILYNVICPWGRFVPFVNNTVLAYTFSGATSPLGDRLWIRFKQFFAVDVLHQMPFLTVHTPNYLHAFAFAVALIVLTASIRKGWISFPLLSLIMIIPLSVLSTGVLRHEHMIPFQVLATLLVASGLASDHQKIRQIFKSQMARRIRLGLLVAALSGNLGVQAMGWKKWQEQPRDRDTILNQSAPVELERHLRKFGTSDRVFFTNIGMHIYQQYMTANRFGGEDITSWDGEATFRATVEKVLHEKDQRRVFVGVSQERDGGPFSFPRTGILLEVLDRNRIPYRLETLSTSRRQNMYDIVIVEPGAGIP